MIIFSREMTAPRATPFTKMLKYPFVLLRTPIKRKFSSVSLSPKIRSSGTVPRKRMRFFFQQPGDTLSPTFKISSSRRCHPLPTLRREARIPPATGSESQKSSRSSSFSAQNYRSLAPETPTPGNDSQPLTGDSLSTAVPWTPDSQNLQGRSLGSATSDEIESISDSDDDSISSEVDWL